MGEIITVKNFINNEFVEPECGHCGTGDGSTLDSGHEAAGKYLDSVDPSTGQTFAKIPNSGQADVNLAVEAALKAFPVWAALSYEKRSEYMMRIADILESRLEEFAKLESKDQGKPVSLAERMDIPRAVHNFRFFATYILHDLNRSRVHDMTGAVQYSIKEPVGVAGLVSPWNLPLYLLTFKLAPALAGGNTVVCKPSELTSVTAFKLCEIIKEAGVPAGVVNMVFGTGARAGHYLVAHPQVPLVSFTGSTLTAEKIRQAGASFNKKYSFELGGKNPAIIFEDADLTKAVATCIRSSFLNQGEICLCTSRIFVQSKIYQAFLDKFVEETKKLKVGDPRDREVFMGALNSKEHWLKVQAAVTGAQAAGATIHRKGENIQDELPKDCQQGYFMYPTVITNVDDSSPAMQCEIFGPVTCVVPFDTEDEVVERANGVEYGLCASVYTQDLSRAHRISQRVQAGTVWVNCWLVRDLNLPFGGNKQSGTGREGGHDSMEFFTNEKTVCLAL